MFVIKHDSIKFLIDNNQYGEAKIVIKQVYHSSEDPDMVLAYIKSTGQDAKGNKIPV